VSVTLIYVLAPIVPHLNSYMTMLLLFISLFTTVHRSKLIVL